MNIAQDALALYLPRCPDLQAGQIGRVRPRAEWNLDHLSEVFCLRPVIDSRTFHFLRKSRPAEEICGLKQCLDQADKEG